MGMIIIGVVVMGCFFYGYVIYAGLRQGSSFRSKSRYRMPRRRTSSHAETAYGKMYFDRDEPRVIQLPENIEREKRRRHIR